MAQNAKEPMAPKSPAMSKPFDLKKYSGRENGAYFQL